MPRKSRFGIRGKGSRTQSPADETAAAQSEAAVLGPSGVSVSVSDQEIGIVSENGNGNENGSASANVLGNVSAV